MKLYWLLFFLVNFVYAQEPAVLSNPSGGDFAIETTLSPDFKLSDFKGKTVFLFFGFTKCPSVCPFTVQRIKKLNSELVAAKDDSVRFLFISIDNERDTKKSLARYAEANGKFFSAGTGSDKKLRSIIEMYGGYFSKIRTPSNKLIIDHSSNVYVINPSGHWVSTVNYNAPYSDYLAAYKKAKEDTSIPQVPRRRTMHILGINQDCDLSKKKCGFVLNDGNEFSMQFSPRPIKTGKTFHIEVKSTSKTYIPREIDFVGIDQNMGLIRPKLIDKGNGNFETDLELPLCEQRSMKWKIRMILEDTQSNLHSIEYRMETID